MHFFIRPRFRLQYVMLRAKVLSISCIVSIFRFPIGFLRIYLLLYKPYGAFQRHLIINVTKVVNDMKFTLEFVLSFKHKLFLVKI